MAYLADGVTGPQKLEIEEQAKDIQVRVGQLGRHIAGFDSDTKKSW